MMPLCRSVSLGVVLCKLIYGLYTAMFESRQELPELMMGNCVRGVLTGAPQNGTGHRISCDKFSHWRSLQALLRDEHDPSDDTLRHDPARGARNRTGLALTETLGTQVPRLPLTNLQ